eukprot:TRINITY_DN11992_c0_g1_i1.p1 TRINITY_DN11992_c0_g1~~TRINITY_DN11992_c0_g1_i1.p1  ORF type:complete len:646 (+),score=165.05 TRINITY_DN11992_c0_g1_i1:149-2086(+)
MDEDIENNERDISDKEDNNEKNFLRRGSLSPKSDLVTIEFVGCKQQLKLIRTAIILYDYNPGKENQLNLKKGETVEIFKVFDNGWVLGRIDGKVGYVPKSYVSSSVKSRKSKKSMMIETSNENMNSFSLNMESEISYKEQIQREINYLDERIIKYVKETEKVLEEHNSVNSKIHWVGSSSTNSNIQQRKSKKSITPTPEESEKILLNNELQAVKLKISNLKMKQVNAVAKRDKLKKTLIEAERISEEIKSGKEMVRENSILDDYLILKKRNLDINPIIENRQRSMTSKLKQQRQILKKKSEQEQFFEDLNNYKGTLRFVKDNDPNSISEDQLNVLKKFFPNTLEYWTQCKFQQKELTRLLGLFEENNIIGVKKYLGLKKVSCFSIESLALYLVENKFFYYTQDSLELISRLEQDHIIVEIKKGFYKLIKIDKEKEKDSSIGYKNEAFNVYEHTLSEIVEYEQEHHKKNLSIPYILYYLTEQVIKRGGTQTEGIFRVSTGQKKMDFYSQKIADHQSYSLDPSEDAHVPANLLKHFLRCIPEPVIPDYTSAMVFANQSHSPKTFNDFLNSLPQTNQNVLKFMSQFIHTMISHESLTKMSFDSFAILFTPIVLINPTTDVLTLLVQQQIEIHFVKGLINHINQNKLYI